MGVSNDYRIGTFEITNDQWSKFEAAYGPVAGYPWNAYDEDSYFPYLNVPANRVSWYEAAQFVNWLNTSTGHHAAYRFVGTQGTDDYRLESWSLDEADNSTNVYRHKDAFYYLPTEDEWVKAAYWNGATLQTYATTSGVAPFQGNGFTGMGWNYYDENFGFATSPAGPWDVGSGSEELNGTFDMMGNVFEWVESPYSDLNFGTASDRTLRGGTYGGGTTELSLSGRYMYGYPALEGAGVGFRVAAEVPEPGTFALLLAGCGVLTRHRRSSKRRVTSRVRQDT